MIKNHFRGPGNGHHEQKVEAQILTIFVKMRDANSLDETNYFTRSSIRYYNLILVKLHFCQKIALSYNRTKIQDPSKINPLLTGRFGGPKSHTFIVKRPILDPNFRQSIFY